MPTSRTSNKNLVLAAMVFAVAMTFIDQTIVAIAIPTSSASSRCRRPARSGSSTATCSALSALFAFGGKLADCSVAGGWSCRRDGFAAARRSAARPHGAVGRDVDHHVPRRSRARAPRCCSRPPLAIVVASFPLRERGKALAIFFGIAGGLTAVGPLAGGYLTEWTWRSIFWINVPVAISRST